MNDRYNDLFDELVKSYYNGKFNETLLRIMTCHKKSPQETFKIITSLCGVSVEFDNNYLQNIKKAITHYSINKKIVEKLDCSSDSCNNIKENKLNCQISCPIDAIKFDKRNNSTYIDNEICIDCGKCVDACKHGRILDKIQFLPVVNLIKNNNNVIAIVAPSIIGQFGNNITLDVLREALMKVGFNDMIEVALAADILSIKESLDYNKHVKNKNDLMLTSCCCPIWVGMIKKVYKELVPDLSPSASPMIVTGRIIKKINPDAKVVFIGPCIAKKAEAKADEFKGVIDFVLTYRELEEIFNCLEINLNDLKGISSIEYVSKHGRLYAESGGVSQSIKSIIEELYPDKAKSFKAISASGIKECKEVLQNALSKKIDANFIEGMGCSGGCVGGPKSLVPISSSTHALHELVNDSKITLPIHNPILDKVLSEIGINSLDDFHDPSKTSILKRTL